MYSYAAMSKNIAILRLTAARDSYQLYCLVHGSAPDKVCLPFYTMP